MEFTELNITPSSFLEATYKAFVGNTQAIKVINELDLENVNIEDLFRTVGKSSEK
jgi:hypothetical protein